MPDRIEKTIELKAPVAKVWTALTDHAQFGEWFMVRLDGPFIVGSRSTGHMTVKGYEHLAWNVEVVAMEKPDRFAFRWHPYAVDADVDYAFEPMTLVEFRLEPIAEGTRLTVVESGFENLPAERRGIAHRMNDGGWAQQVRNIQAYVER